MVLVLELGPIISIDEEKKKMVGKLAFGSFLIMIISTVAFAQHSFSDVNPDAHGTVIPRQQLPQTSRQNLDFYADQTLFETAAPGLTVEPFLSSLVGPASLCTDFAPLNSTTLPDNCFAAGELAAGFTLNMDPPNEDYVYLTTGFLGAPFEIIGPNAFADDLYLYFDNANAIGFDLVGDLVGPVTVSIEIYSGPNLLGTTTAIGSATGLFWGVTSTDPITEIRLIGTTGSDGELIGHLQFGTYAAIPTLGTIGMISLFTLLMLGGVVLMLKQRKA